MRHNQSWAVGLSVAAGLVCAFSGCAERTRDGHSGLDTGEPVNTGLNQIGQEPGLPVPEPGELIDAELTDSSIQAQIEESARQLSVYFANLEIDGPVDEPHEERAAISSEGNPGSGEPDGLVAERIESGAGGDEDRGSTPTQPNPEGSSVNDPGSVRVSLLAAAGADGIEDLDETGDETRADEVSGGDDGDGAPAGTGPTGNGETEGAVDQEPEARRDRLARELAGILGELIASGEDPGASALALASLETLLPDDIEALVDEGVLSDAERASLDAARELLRAMQSDGEIASPDRVSEQLEEIKQRLDAWAGLTIKRAALCTSVQGYGRYETFPSYRFVAGRAQEVIVYTELERFAQRESIGPDGQARYSVELSQRLELYHVADDLNTWNRAAETVRDESRNRLRDYYLTNMVRLPANLGVGRYHLKVVMRDLIGEKVAETIIPIEIVAR